ncbi:MAG: hypothetical protein E7213_02200 [Clostridium sp.]|nr:hypothetical protein [Clostridium sp.]
MFTEKMNLIYSVLKEEGFELSSASYAKDEYHIFYKSGLVLTIDLSTDFITATMMYFDINHEFVSYTYNLDIDSSFDDLLEHVLNVISTESMILKWNLTLYEIIHLSKDIFLSARDIKQCTTNENLSSLKVDRIMNFDKKLFDMLLGPSDPNNQITLLYNKLNDNGFKIMFLSKSNTGISNITQALFVNKGVLITIFYEESGVVLCGNIHFQTSSPLEDDEFIGDDNIIKDNYNQTLYKIKFTNDIFNHILLLMDKGKILNKMTEYTYEKINLTSALEHVSKKFHTRLVSISNELASEDLKMLGME